LEIREEEVVSENPLIAKRRRYERRSVAERVRSVLPALSFTVDEG
jgi:hypothetical protein